MSTESIGDEQSGEQPPISLATFLREHVPRFLAGAIERVDLLVLDERYHGGIQEAWREAQDDLLALADRVDELTDEELASVGLSGIQLEIKLTPAVGAIDEALGDLVGKLGELGAKAWLKIIRSFKAAAGFVNRPMDSPLEIVFKDGVPIVGHVSKEPKDLLENHAGLIEKKVLDELDDLDDADDDESSGNREDDQHDPFDIDGLYEGRD